MEDEHEAPDTTRARGRLRGSGRRRHPDHRHPRRDRPAVVPRSAEEGPGRDGQVQRSQRCLSDRNLLAERQTYVGCTIPASSGLPVGTGTGSGKVQISIPSATGYRVTAYSKSRCNFIITRATTGRITRTTSGGTYCSVTSW
jgi:hypothetical protein